MEKNLNQFEFENYVIKKQLNWNESEQKEKNLDILSVISIIAYKKKLTPIKSV
jgi:hypothetical protein